jgi:hypothetical protein
MIITKGFKGLHCCSTLSSTTCKLSTLLLLAHPINTNKRDLKQKFKHNACSLDFKNSFFCWHALAKGNETQQPKEQKIGDVKFEV